MFGGNLQNHIEIISKGAHMLVILQIIGLSVLIGIILVCFVVFYANIAYQISLKRAKHREAYLSKKFIERAEVGPNEYS